MQQPHSKLSQFLANNHGVLGLYGLRALPRETLNSIMFTGPRGHCVAIKLPDTVNQTETWRLTESDGSLRYVALPELTPIPAQRATVTISA